MPKTRKKTRSQATRRPPLLPARFDPHNLVEATLEVPYHVAPGTIAYVAHGSIADVPAEGRADVRTGGIVIVRPYGYAMLHSGAVGYALDPRSVLVPLDGATAYYLPHARRAIQGATGRARLIEIDEVPNWATLRIKYRADSNDTTGTTTL
jgi:hypothetical protein